MKRSEAEQLTESIKQELTEKGIPMNIRNGTNEIIAAYISEIVEKKISIDRPLGTIASRNDVYEYCPTCGATIGNSAVYCKKCGSMIREAV